MNRLEGRVALVTGGARGLGAATSERMASEGARVLITDLLDEDGQATVERICKAGGVAEYFHHDVTNEDDWIAAVKKAADTFGGLDILVNNAGISSGAASITEVSLEDWRRVMAVNVDGVFLGHKHAIPEMEKRSQTWRGGASIINLSSIGGLVGLGRAAAYSTSKGAVKLMTKCVALECGERGNKIRVNSVHPGYIFTPMVEQAIADVTEAGAAPNEEETKEMFKTLHPIGRMGIPTDIGDAIAFLASDDAAFMTGAELVVDGGYTAQ